MTVVFYLAFGLGAFLYSSVGHGGGSAYLAILALAGIAPNVAKPTSLCLNIAVSAIALFRFARAEKLGTQLRPFPLLLGSIPMAFVGGGLTLPALYRWGAGLILVASSALMALDRRSSPAEEEPESAKVQLQVWHWVVMGASIGLVSGMTGTGGGIFLSAGLSFVGLASQRQLAQLAALFIFCNSIAGIFGAHTLWVNLVPEQVLILASICVCGGLLGSTYGSRYLSERGLKRALSLVLLIAAAKLMGL